MKIEREDSMSCAFINEEAENWVTEGWIYLRNDNWEKAFELFSKASEKNYPRGWMALAIMYADGLAWFEKEDVLSLDRQHEDTKANQFFGLIKEAADPKKMNNLVAQCCLGKMYERGYGVTRNHNRAEKLYRLAADQGYVIAQFYLAQMYYFGIGIDEDDEQAIHFYRLAAKQKHHIALYRLWYLCVYGDGIEIDKSAALDYLRQSAKCGNDEAQVQMGQLCLDRGDEKQAKAFFQAAADKGNTGAQVRLGAMYARGEGGQQDYQKAKALYEQAAARKNRLSLGANFSLAELYERGLGVEQDDKKAIALYKSTALSGIATLEEIAIDGLGYYDEYEDADNDYDLDDHDSYLENHVYQ